MKKILITLFIILLSSNFVFADGDLWDNFGDSGIYGQKPVSDDEFDKALESKKKKKKRNKNIPKGENFSRSNETESINNKKEELPILLVPVNLKINENKILPIGHYQVEGEKKNGEVYLNLYQAHDLIARLPAEETQDDFGEDVIIFAKLEAHGDYHVQIMYGGVEFNAYTIIDIE